MGVEQPAHCKQGNQWECHLVCISRRHRCPSLSPICIADSNGLLDVDVIGTGNVKLQRPLTASLN